MSIEERITGSENRKHINVLLLTEPIGPAVTTEHRAMWRSLNRDIKVLEYIWARMVPEQPRFDYHNCKYVEWVADNGTKIKGLRHKKSNKSHGVLREVKNNGNSGFYTYKNGTQHGLTLVIYKEIVSATIWQDGKEVFRL